MAEINGDFSDNILDGTAEDDVINGFGGNDIITGGAGDDVIDGGSGDDIITGGAGNDTLTGGRGDDTYVFSAGHGSDIIDNFGGLFIDGASDRVVFTDYSSADATFSRVAPSGSDIFNLVVTLQNGDEILINDALLGSEADGPIVVSEFEFQGDGVTIDIDTVRATILSESITTGDDEIFGFSTDDVIAGGAGIDRLMGLSGNDTIIGGLGDDLLQGGSGDDRYIFTSGDGIDSIFNDAFFDRNDSDTVVFTNISSTDAVFSIFSTGFIENDNLEIELPGDDACLLYTSPSPRDQRGSRMPSSA